MRILRVGVFVLLSLASCTHPVPPAAPPPSPPPAPVGHVYPVAIAVPLAPKRVHLSLANKVALQQAFNVIGLKSALMVGALTCGQQDRYDAFMTAFQPHVLAEQHVMDAYFRRIGGQAKEDDYVTLLANNQSVNSEAEGALFCLNSAAEFKAVMSLQSPDQLDQFVTDQPPQARP